MDINNPLPPDRWYDDSGLLVRCKTLLLGTWDMAGTPGKNLPHLLGADFTKILGVTVWIIADDGLRIYNLSTFIDAADPALLSGGIQYIDNTNIRLYRRTGGWFNSVSFDDAVMNRGRAVITYLV